MDTMRVAQVSRPGGPLDVDEQLNGKSARATTLEVTSEPGAASAPHRHPGPVFGYVLEGELEFQAGDIVRPNTYFFW